MTKWELARYLLDAKKSVDSIMYIADVLPELEHIPVRAYVNSNRQTFYICCCVLLDNVYLSKRKSKLSAVRIRLSQKCTISEIKIMLIRTRTMKR